MKYNLNLSILTRLCIISVLLSVVIPAHAQQKAVQIAASDGNGSPLRASDKGKPISESYNGKITSVNMPSYTFQLETNSHQSIIVALSLASVMENVQPNIKSSDLSIGDSVFIERGQVAGVPEADEPYTVTALNPLTLRLDGDPHFAEVTGSDPIEVKLPFVETATNRRVGTVAMKGTQHFNAVTLTLDTVGPDVILFRRILPLRLTDLHTGQAVLVIAAKYPDGKYEAEQVLAGIKMPFLTFNGVKQISREATTLSP